LLMTESPPCPPPSTRRKYILRLKTPGRPR
jgi:hypothetical protein